MLVGLHGLLLSLTISEVGIHIYRVSHVKGKITKLFSWDLKKIIAQFTSATIVQPHVGCETASMAEGYRIRFHES